MANDNPPDGFDEYIASAPPADSPPEGFNDYLGELKAEKYGTIGQMLKTAAEGLAEGIAGPLAPMAEVGLGIADKEDILARAQENPTTKTGAEVVGLVGSAFIPGGQGKLLAQAGVGGAKALGMAGAKAGFIAAAKEGAVKGAIESALFQGGKELSEAFLTDPSKVADHAISDMGLATVLGGVFGGAFGAAAKGLMKKAPEALVSQADVAAHESGDLATLIKSDPSIPKAKKDGLLSELNIFKKKANSAEIESATKELGLPTTPGMLSDSRLIQTQVDALAHSPYSLAGERVSQQLDTAYEAAESVLKGATESGNRLSRDQLGGKLQETLSESVRAAYAPQKAAFEELAALHESIPVEIDALENLGKSFGQIKEVKLSPNTQEGRLVREVLDLTKNVQTAEDLTTIRNMASLKPQGAGPDPLGWLKGKIRDEIAQVQEDAIRRYSRSFPRNDEAGALFASKLDMAEAAREGYKPYIKKLNTLSNWLGKGKIHGTEDALNFMNDRLSATDVAKRLFSSSKDPEFIKFFSKEFPEQFKMIRDYQRMDLVENSMRDGAFSPKTLFKKFNDMEPEIQKSLYSAEEIKKIKASEVYFKEAFPKNFNPSGTDHTRALRNAMESPKGLLLSNVRDATMEKMIQWSEKGSDLANAHQLGRSTAKGWKMAVDSTKAVFNASKELPAKLIPIAAHRDKLDRLVSESIKNPDRLYGINDNNPVQEYNEPFAATSARAVAYLHSLKPVEDPSAPLDARKPASSSQKGAYNRALDIAQQPLVTMKFLKEGTLTSQDVTTLKVVYPGLYDQLSQRLLQEMVHAKEKKVVIPYKTKMSLSLFLGQPLDSSLTPQAIQAAQPATPQQAPGPQGGKPPAYNSVKGLDSLAKGSQTPGQARQNRDTSQ